MRSFPHKCAVFRPETQFFAKIASSRKNTQFCSCHPSRGLAKNGMTIYRISKKARPVTEEMC